MSSYLVSFLGWMMLIIVIFNPGNVSGVCTNKDIRITQTRVPLPTSGRPQYRVQIVNTCPSQCAPSDIHLHCGRFASTTTINPGTLKRLSNDDCLVNGGKPLRTGESVKFTSSNNYPLTVLSAKFC